MQRVDNEKIRRLEWDALFAACHIVLMGVSLKSQGVLNITHATEKCMENVGWSSAGGCFEFITVIHSITDTVYRFVMESSGGEKKKKNF